MALPLAMMVAIAALAAFEGSSAWSQLPERMATSFGFDGVATGWMRRGAFFTLIAAVFAGWIVLFGGLAAALPRVPDSLFNLPHRDHWLAPERRRATTATLQAWMAWVGAGGMLFLAWTTHLVLEANLANAPRLPGHFVWGLLAAFAALAAGLWWLHRRFRGPA